MTVTYIHISYNVSCGCMYSSEEEEQSQGEGNAKVEVDKVEKSFNQFFSVEVRTLHKLEQDDSSQLCNLC